MFERETDVLHSEPTLDGLYLAKVIENSDPLCLERVKVRVLGVHDWDNEDKENSIWAMHLAPSKQSSGEIPDPEDWLWVTFIRPDDPMSCLWLGWARVKG
jgi:hypothetical protein